MTRNSRFSVRGLQQHRHLHYAIWLVACGASLSCYNGTAADELSRELETLDTTVVSASGFEQLISEAPASVSVVTPEDLETRPITDFMDVIRTVPGAALTNGEGRNVDISLRGMPAGYTLILIDGKRQNLNGIARNGNNNVKQSFMPPPSAIERIEIIRGPMSTLYGADAMGGVINVITKKSSNAWNGEVSVDSTLQEESDFGDGRGASFFLGGPIYKDTLGLQISGREQYREEDNVPRGEPERTNRNLTGKLWYKPTDNQELMLETSHEYFNMHAWVAGRSVGSLWDQTTRRETWSISHQGNFAFGDTLIAFQKEDAEKGDVEADNWTLDAKIVSPWEFHGDHTTSFGIQMTSNEVNSWNIESVEGDVIDVITQENQAIFAEDTWNLTDDWSLTLGLRYDHPDDFDSHVSPRAYLVYSPTDHLTLKGGVATGFKAPRADYVAPGLVTESESTSTGALSYTYANSEMKPETSINYEIAAIWEGLNQTNLAVTLFRTEYKDKLDSLNYSTVYADEDGNFLVGDRVDPQGYCSDALARMDYACSWSYRTNVDSAWSHGVEVTLDMPLSEALSLNASYTWLDSEEETGEDAGQPLSGAPQNNLVTTLEWAVSSQLNTWASYSYRSKLRASNRPAPGCFDDDSCPALGLLDIGATIYYGAALHFNVGVLNLTNRDWSDYDSKGSVEDGRRLFMRATYRF